MSDFSRTRKYSTMEKTIMLPELVAFIIRYNESEKMREHELALNSTVQAATKYSWLLASLTTQHSRALMTMVKSYGYEILCAIGDELCKSTVPSDKEIDHSQKINERITKVSVPITHLLLLANVSGMDFASEHLALGIFLLSQDPDTVIQSARTIFPEGNQGPSIRGDYVLIITLGFAAIIASVKMPIVELYKCAEAFKLNNMIRATLRNMKYVRHDYSRELVGPGQSTVHPVIQEVIHSLYVLSRYRTERLINTFCSPLMARIQDQTKPLTSRLRMNSFNAFIIDLLPPVNDNLGEYKRLSTFDSSTIMAFMTSLISSFQKSKGSDTVAEDNEQLQKICDQTQKKITYNANLNKDTDVVNKASTSSPLPRGWPSVHAITPKEDDNHTHITNDI